MKYWRCKECGYARYFSGNPNSTPRQNCLKCGAIMPNWTGPFATEAEARGDKWKKDYEAEGGNPHAETIFDVYDETQWEDTNPPDRRWWRCKECGNITTCKEYGCCMHKRLCGPFATEDDAQKYSHTRHRWRCKACGEVSGTCASVDWNNRPWGAAKCDKCGSKSGWHGPFATEQEAKDYKDIHLKMDDGYPRWQANTDRTSDVLWKWDDRMKDKMLEAWKAITYNPGNKFNVIFDEFQDYKQSEEDNKMSSSIFCDVCRGSFPIEETSLIVFDAIKKNREGNAIEKQKAYNSHICDTCFTTLMAEPTVAKLPWSKWTKDDDDE